MNQEKKLSIMEFSRLTGIKRENLRFYDRIGLLCPETRGDNNYRYYSRHQLSTAYLIGSLRWIGVGIEEIKQYSTQRSPEKSLALLAQQDARIQAEIEQLKETQKVMALHSEMIQQALAHEQNALFLQKKECEAIFLCPPIPPHMNHDEGEVVAYEYAGAQGLNLGYPLGTRLAQPCVEAGGNAPCAQYYFKAEKYANAQKPAGLYAIAYGQYDPWKSEPLYRRLLSFIKAQGLRICGDAYEEYPLSDLSVSSVECYGIRVEIPVITARP